MNRTSIASGAIITIDDSLLLQKNNRYNRWNIISGHYEKTLDESSIKNTIIREIQEELPGLRYLIDFKIKEIHKNRIFWNTEDIREGKEYNTLYIFKFYQVEILYKEKEFPERIFENKSKAMEYFIEQGNIFIPIKELKEIINLKDTPILSFEYEKETFSLALPIKKGLEVFLNPKMEINNTHLEIEKRITKPIAFNLEIKPKEKIELKIQMISAKDANLEPSNSMKEILEISERTDSPLGVIITPSDTFLNSETFTSLKKIKETGFDFINFQNHIPTVEILEIIEQLELFFIQTH